MLEFSKISGRNKIQTKLTKLSSFVLSQLIQAHSLISLWKYLLWTVQVVSVFETWKPKSLASVREYVLYIRLLAPSHSRWLGLSQRMFILWDLGDFQSLNWRSCPVLPIFPYACVKCSCSIQTHYPPLSCALVFTGRNWVWTEHSALI